MKNAFFLFIAILMISCFSNTSEENNSIRKKKTTVSKKREISTIFQAQGNLNYNDLLKKSAEAKKPLLLYFTSFSARSTSRMEDYILQNKAIIQRLKNDFIFVPLYLDSKEKLPQNELVRNQTTPKTVGQKYYRWQVEKFETNAQPFFVIVDEKGNKIKDMMYTKDASTINDFFLNFYSYFYNLTKTNICQSQRNNTKE